MGVVLAHDLTDDAGGLDVRSVGSQTQLAHAKEDPALHRLEPVPSIGQSARVDDAVGVLEEGVLHLLSDIDVDDVLDDVLGRRCGRAAASHA